MARVHSKGTGLNWSELVGTDDLSCSFYKSRNSDKKLAGGKGMFLNHNMGPANSSLNVTGDDEETLDF